MSQMISRLSAYIESKKMSIRKFETAIGASNGLISRAIKQGSDVYAKWISITVDKFPDLNPIWLLTGKGEMIIEVSQGADPSVTKGMKSTFSLENVHRIIPTSTKSAESEENRDKTAMSVEIYLQQLFTKFDNMEASMVQLRQDFTSLERKVKGELSMIHESKPK